MMLFCLQKQQKFAVNYVNPGSKDALKLIVTISMMPISSKGGLVLLFFSCFLIVSFSRHAIELRLMVGQAILHSAGFNQQFFSIRVNVNS